MKNVQLVMICLMFGAVLFFVNLVNLKVTTKANELKELITYQGFTPLSEKKITLEIYQHFHYLHATTLHALMNAKSDAQRDSVLSVYDEIMDENFKWLNKQYE